MVEKSLPNMVDMVIRLFEEGRYMVIVNGVIDNVPFASWLDQAAIP